MRGSATGSATRARSRRCFGARPPTHRRCSVPPALRACRSSTSPPGPHGMPGGRRGPALVEPETLALIHRPRIKTGPMPGARAGTPQEGEYALGWGVVKFDWSTMPLLNHGGSNSMNLATILVDTDQDLAVVVLTNFPERQAKAAVGAVMEMLYRRYGTKAN